MTESGTEFVVGSAEQASDRIWSERAASYGFALDGHVSSRLKLALVRQYLRPQDRACDVGCANGLFLREIARGCASATGVDLNADMLDLARQALAQSDVRNAELLQCSAAAIPLPDASFDLVCCFSTLLLIPDRDAALDELARLVRPGGYLVLDVAGRYNLSYLYWRRWYRRRGHFGVHAFAFGDIARQLAARSMAIVEAHALGLCDQWSYVPGLHRWRRIERIFHASPDPAANLDYRLSNLPGLFRLAGRWYVVARKEVSA